MNEQNTRFMVRYFSKQENRYLLNSEIQAIFGMSCLMQKVKDTGLQAINVSLSGDNEELYVTEQCTGEKDQFGKIVFEGDIVDQYSPMEDCRRRCVVEWVSEAGGGYVCRYLDGIGNPCAHGNSEGTYFDGAYCVVVGNIHDGTSNAETSVPQGEYK